VETLLQDLRALLARQVENLKTLESLIRQQQDALVKRDVGAILESVAAEEECLRCVQQMERDRSRLMARISGVLGLGDGGITLRQLTENLDPTVGEELRSTGETIREALENIGRVNRENQMLIQHSLEFVHEMLGVLTQDGSGKQIYECSGTLRTGSPGHALVDRTT